MPRRDTKGIIQAKTSRSEPLQIVPKNVPYNKILELQHPSVEFGIIISRFFHAVPRKKSYTKAALYW